MTTYSPTMTAADALLWNIEQDPVLRSTITAVALFDCTPDWDRLVARLTRSALDVPRLRQKVVVPPFGLGPPEWVDDPEFDIGYHLRRVRAPAPGTLRSVLDIAEPLSMAGFDRTRPLWEFTLIEDLEGGQAALVQKLHHSIADGVGGMRLAASMLDLERDATTATVELPTVAATSAADLAARSVARQVRGIAGAAGRAPRLLGAASASATRHPMATITDAAAMVSSVGRMLAPASGPTSPLLAGRTLGRRFDVLEMPLDALRDAAHDAGCSLNAAFLAASVGGAARYHAKHGVVVEDLRVDMPVNLRAEGDPEGGNRFAPTRFRLPMRVEDPVARMRVVGAIANRWRAEPALTITDFLAGALNALPRQVTTGIFASMLKGVDATITNVPGIPVETYIAGAKVVREWALAPPSGAAISISLVSHVGTACIGVTCDTGAVHDVDGFIACLVDGFDEVLAGRAETRLRS